MQTSRVDEQRKRQKCYIRFGFDRFTKKKLYGANIRKNEHGNETITRLGKKQIFGMAA